MSTNLMTDHQPITPRLRADLGIPAKGSTLLVVRGNINRDGITDSVLSNIVGVIRWVIMDHFENPSGLLIGSLSIGWRKDRLNAVNELIAEFGQIPTNSPKRGIPYRPIDGDLSTLCIFGCHAFL